METTPNNAVSPQEGEEVAIIRRNLCKHRGGGWDTAPADDVLAFWERLTEDLREHYSAGQPNIFTGKDKR